MQQLRHALRSIGVRYVFPETSSDLAVKAEDGDVTSKKVSQKKKSKPVTKTAGPSLKKNE